MNLKPTCYWRHSAQAGPLGQGSSGCAPAEQWTRQAARLGPNPLPRPCRQPRHSASLGCRRKLRRLPAQCMTSGTVAEGCKVKTSCFLIMHGHCTPPMVGFILGHEPVGLGLLQAAICQAALCAFHLPLSPLSPQPQRESWAPSGMGQGFPQMPAEECVHACVCVCARMCVVSIPLMLPGKVSPGSRHSHTSAL